MFHKNSMVEKHTGEDILFKTVIKLQQLNIILVNFKKAQIYSSLPRSKFHRIQWNPCPLKKAYTFSEASSTELRERLKSE